MKLRMLAMATVAAAALSTPAMAGDGWYLGLGGGWDNQVGYRVKSTAGALAGGGAKINSQDSAIGVASVGYKWAEGWRLENEFSFTQHDTSLNGTGAFNATGGIGKDLSVLAKRYQTRWLVADYEAGDMVVHTSYMIHAATQNNSSAGRMRLSTDIRYQRIRDEIDARWQQHWTLDDML